MRQVILDRVITEGQFHIGQSEGVSHVDSERRNLQENKMCKALRSVHAWQAQGTARRQCVWSRASSRKVADEVRKTVSGKTCRALKTTVRTLLEFCMRWEAFEMF